MNPVLVTGAGGLLGAHLVPLLAKDAEVIALGRGGAEGPNVTHIEADLSRPIDPARLPRRIGGVVYLAQSPRFREFPEGADDVFVVNVAQPLALLDHARRAGAESFVYASSGSVYAPSATPLREDDPAPANGFYAASKMAAEQLARPYGGEMGVTLLRFFFIYGRGQNRTMLLPRLVDSVREGRPVTLQGPDGISINPVHAEDAARATKAAIALRGTDVVNVAGPETLSIRRICEIAGARVGRAPMFESGPAGSDVVADTTVMRERLASPTIRFEEGVADLL